MKCFLFLIRQSKLFMLDVKYLILDIFRRIRVVKHKCKLAWQRRRIPKDEFHRDLDMDMDMLMDFDDEDRQAYLKVLYKQRETAHLREIEHEM